MNTVSESLRILAPRLVVAGFVTVALLLAQAPGAMLHGRPSQDVVLRETGHPSQKDDPSGFEVAAVLVENVAGAARDRPESNIIVVGRLGDGERSQDLNWRRLRAVRNYLATDKRLPNSVIIAVGERRAGLGAVEFYVGGKLVQSIAVARRQNIRFYE